MEENIRNSFEWDCALSDIYEEIISSPKKKIEIEGDFAWRGEGEHVSYIPVSEVSRILDKHKKFFGKWK